MTGRPPSRRMESRKLAQICHRHADNKKGEDTVVLDVRRLSSVADYFVIVSASSDPHLRAIVEEISVRLKQDEDVRPLSVDGTSAAGWVVLDYFDVIVHVMRTDLRERYDLEGLWNDAPRVRVPEQSG